jgi:hypothetical protein
MRSVSPAGSKIADWFLTRRQHRIGRAACIARLTYTKDGLRPVQADPKLDFPDSVRSIFSFLFHILRDMWICHQGRRKEANCWRRSTHEMSRLFSRVD